jgi:hypothetical protein
MTTASRKRDRPATLLVGAFERDNFGDSLFLSLSQKLLESTSIAAASVLSADMSHVSGTRVMSLDTALRARSWDTVWVVGGEVGGVTVSDAMPMSLPEPAGSSYEELGVDDRARFDSLVTGLDSGASAYIPDLSRYPLAQHADLVLHSVGLSGVIRGPEGTATGAEARALASARVVTVRERASEAVLVGLGKPPRLAPDLVHSMPLILPELRPASSAEGHRPTMVFQMNDGMFRAADLEHVAEVVLAAARDLGARPLLFPAGTARHHDSALAYERLAATMRDRDPSAHVEVVRTRNPLELAMIIAGSVCWIGSSLHGRIVASAYHVPRVSLAVEKVTTYARTWSDGMPFDTDLEDVGDAAAQAVARRDDPVQVETDLSLSHLAHQAALTAVREVRHV